MGFFGVGKKLEDYGWLLGSWKIEKKFEELE
jgi:hypothetical protein